MGTNQTSILPRIGAVVVPSRPKRGPAPAAASVRIEPALAEDAPAIAAVEALAFAGTQDAFRTRQIQSLLGNPRACTLVARKGNGIVAWCAALTRRHPNWSSGRIYSVAVLPDCVGQGVGRRLLAASLEALHERGVDRVYLEVRESNGPAIALYHDMGFVIVASLPSYYGPGIDGLRMRRVAPEPRHPTHRR